MEKNKEKLSKRAFYVITLIENTEINIEDFKTIRTYLLNLGNDILRLDGESNE